jgi:hypothetical protein
VLSKRRDLNGVCLWGSIPLNTEYVVRRKKAFNPSRTSLLVRFEVFTAGTVKNDVFLDVTPCGSCKNRRFGGT